MKTIVQQTLPRAPHASRRAPGAIRLRIAHLACAAAFFCVAGGHWAALQTVAWIGMLRAYSKTTTITRAVAETFSGEKPCPLCKAIARERSKENDRPTAPRFVKKLDAPDADVAEAVAPPAAVPDAHPRPGPAFAALRAEPPPGPIPKRADRA